MEVWYSRFKSNSLGLGVVGLTVVQEALLIAPSPSPENNDTETLDELDMAAMAISPDLDFVWVIK